MSVLNCGSCRGSIPAAKPVKQSLNCSSCGGSVGIKKQAVQLNSNAGTISAHQGKKLNLSV